VTAPRYFVQRDDGPWTEVLAAGFAAAEREVGMALHGVIAPVTQGFTGVSHMGVLVRGRLVRDVLAIVGSRHWQDNKDGWTRAAEIIEARLNYGHDGPRPDAVVSGHARGIDRLGEDIADALDIVVISHEPKHRVPYTPAVFFERNQLIADDATRGLAIVSRAAKTHGADDTVERMKRQGKPVERIEI
jgi:hypothetical protein